MTALARRRRRPADPAEARRLARRLLARAGIRPRRFTSREAPAAALAKVLVVTPPDSPHGRLLGAVLRAKPGRPVAELPAEHRAVRELLRRGIPPTPAAVAGELANLERRRQAEADSEARVRAIVAADGPRAAALVAEVWQATGAGPTWGELGRALGWRFKGAEHRRNRDRDRAVRGLAAAGWLIVGDAPRSLRPGPKDR